MINARSETLESKPSFKHALANRRCVIPMDGYYEWTKAAGGQSKQPFLIEPADGQVKFMAGLWEENQQLDDEGGDPFVYHHYNACQFYDCSRSSADARLHS